MVQRVLNAIAKGFGDGGNQFGAEFAPDRITAQRQRQPSQLEPPFSQVKDFVQAGFVIGELAFVDNQAGLKFSGSNLRNNLIEGHHNSFDLGCKQLQSEISGGQGPGNCDLHPLQLFQAKAAGGDDHGAIFVAHASTAIHERIFFLDIRIRMEGDGADVVETFHGFTIEGLNIGQSVAEFQPGHADFIGRQAIEHESIIRVGAMGHRDFANGRRDRRRGHTYISCSFLFYWFVRRCGNTRDLFLHCRSLFHCSTDSCSGSDSDWISFKVFFSA